MTTRTLPDSNTGVSVNYGTLGASATGSAFTLTAALLLGGLIERTPASASTDTTDTGANIDAAMPGVQVGDTFAVTIANIAGTGSITFAGGTGVTLRGGLVLATVKAATITFRKTGVALWTGYVVVGV